MKYVIDVPEDRVHGDMLCAMGTMEDGESHYLPTGIITVPYDESEAEQRGREEAWELIKAIGKMSDDDMVNCFGTSIIVNLSYAEASERYDAWKKNETIQIGDEVILPDGRRFVVYHILDGRLCGSGIGYRGKVDSWTGVEQKNVRKGRHFPEVAELLEKMRNPDADH